MSKISIVEALRLVTIATKNYVDKQDTSINSSIATTNNRVDNLLQKYPSFSSSERQTELEDIRQSISSDKYTDFTGEVYTSAGTAVRTQINTLLNYLDSLDEDVETKADGYLIDDDNKFYLLSNGKKITAGVSIATDLSDYYTKGQINGLLANYASADDLATLSNTVANLNALEDLDIEFDETTSELAWYKKGDANPLGTITITGTGGGGSSAGTTFKMTYINESSFTAIYGDTNIKIAFRWSSIYADDNSSTGPGSMVLNVNGVRADQDTNVAQGDYEYDVSSLLGRGTNSVQVILTDNTGSVRTLRWTITTVSLELTSTFDAYTAYYDDATFTYTVTAGGTFEKTVHFILNGQEIKTVTTTSSGGISTQTIPYQAHGAYPLTVYVTATVNGTELTSNVLYYEIIFVNKSSSTPIIASSFNETTVKQYDNVTIPYLIWDPTYTSSTSSTSRNCRLEAFNKNTEEFTINSSINPDRTLQYWTLKFTTTDDYRLRIYVGTRYREFNLSVEPLDISASPITNSLEAEFTTTGRSNSQSNYNVWQSSTAEGGTYKASFPSTFDWVNGGWQVDSDGNSVMRIKASSEKVTIPLKLFSTDFKNTGKSIKIIFRCKNSINYDTKIIDCYDNTNDDLESEKRQGIGLTLYANKGIFNSRDIQMEVPYKEDSYIEMDLVIYPSTQNSLILWYLQGIPCSASIYEATDTFVQENLQTLSLGSSECDLDIYLIKTYNKVLNQYEILNNFILDAPNSDEMVERYQRNDIYDDYHNIVLDKLKTKYMIITSDASQYDYIFPQVKIKDRANPPIKGTIAYYDPDNSKKNFTSNNVGIGMQGTSSAGYGRAALNLNVDFQVDGFNYSESGTKESTFAMSSNSIPVDYFCLKADVASSEGANNVILTDEYNLYDPYVSDPQLDELLDAAAAKGYEPKHNRETERSELVTELKNQGYTNKIRGTIEGQPIIVFHNDSSGSKYTTTQFYGKFNMNNDKINYDVFGQNRDKYPQQCCVEFLTNESLYCVFKEDDFSDDKWEDGFEFRFPKKGYTQTDIDNLHRVVSWVKSTDTTAATDASITPVVYNGVTYNKDTAEYRLAKFKAEFEDYFILDSAIWLYIFTERHLMVDNRAKNVFMATDDGIHWHFKNDYDNDTALGIDNIGRLSHSYGVEYRDGSQSYGGEESVLWINLAKCFATEISNMVTVKESEGAFNAERLSAKFKSHQDEWPEAIWIEDMFKKYINPYVDYNDRTYISMMLGNKDLQRDWFLFYQDRYMSSKYNGPTVISDAIQMRITKPSATDTYNSPNIVPPNQDLTITPYSDMYVLVKYGNGDYQKIKAKRGEAVTMTAPTFGETGSGGVETYIYNASLLTDIGDLSACYLSWLDISRASKLQRIIAGSQIEGYQNQAWQAGTSISFNSDLINTIDITGLIYLNTTIGISGCTALKYFYAENTNVPSVTLASNSNIQIMKLPATITNLKLQYLQQLKTLTLQGYNSLSSITAEYLSTTADQLLVNIINNSVNLTSVRLLDIYWILSGDGSDTFDILKKCKGITESGSLATSSTNSYVTGTVEIETIKESTLAEYRKQFPSLSFLFNKTLYTLSFRNYDNSVLAEYTVIKGSDGYDPITTVDANNIKIDTPKKPSDSKYNYYYNSWSNSYMNVTEDRILTATYDAVARHYNVYFFKEDYETFAANPSAYTPYYSITGDEEGKNTTAISYGGDVDMNTIPDPLEDESGTWLKGGWTVVKTDGWRDESTIIPPNFEELDTNETLTIQNIIGTTLCFAVTSKVTLPASKKEFQSCSWGEINAVLNAATAGKLNLSDWWTLGQSKSAILNTKESTLWTLISMDNQKGIDLLPAYTSVQAYQMNSQKRKSYCYTINGIDADSDTFTYEYTGNSDYIVLAPQFNSIDRLGRPLLTTITVTTGGQTKTYDFTKGATLPSGIEFESTDGELIYNEAGFTELSGNVSIRIPVSNSSVVKIETFLKGESWNNGGWFYSELRERANDEFYNSLPGLMQALVTPKKRVNSIGNYTDIEITYDGDDGTSTAELKAMNDEDIFITTEDKIWILNNAEVTSIAADVDKYPVYAKEGSTFSVFTGNDSRVRHRPETALNPKNEFYWLGSTYVDYANGFGAVDKNGKWNQGYPAYSYFPCAFAIEMSATE
jgi:hypothetical protein